MSFFSFHDLDMNGKDIFLNFNHYLKWLTPSQAAEHLQISLPTFKKLTVLGKLTAYKTGRKVHFKLSEINQAITENRMQYKYYKNENMSTTKTQVRIKEALDIKKALEPKQFYSNDKDEELFDPNILESEEDEEDFDLPPLTQKEVNEQLDKSKERVEKANLHLHNRLEKTFSNKFPIEVFPQCIQQYIEDLEKCFRYPKEFTASGILTAVAGALGNKVQAELKKGQLTVGMLYIAIVGSPGSNKSSPLERVLQPLNKIESECAKEYLREHDAYLEEIAQKKQATEPKEKRYLVNDATMEALMEIMEENDITVYYDELQGFLNSMNRYRAGDDMQKWLSIWSSKPLRTDRKGRKGKLIIHPFANCIGTIQTEVLISSLSAINANNGFIERLLYATFKRKIKSGWNTLEINEKLERNYYEIIKRITEIPIEYNNLNERDPKLLKFESDAFEKIIAWQNDNVSLCDNITNSQLIGIYRKLDIYVLRFCLILAVLDYAARMPKLLVSPKSVLKIKLEHVESAIKLAEYFRNSAKFILSLIPEKVSIGKLDKRFQDFYRALPEKFSTKKAQEVGKNLKLSGRTVFNYLYMDTCFKNIKHGYYEKCYVER